MSTHTELFQQDFMVWLKLGPIGMRLLRHPQHPWHPAQKCVM